MITLTAWQDGSDIYVSPSAIISIRRLPASVSDYFPDQPPRELGARTAVHTVSDIFLVRETPSEIMELCKTLDTSNPEA